MGDHHTLRSGRAARRELKERRIVRLDRDVDALQAHRWRRSSSIVTTLRGSLRSRRGGSTYLFGRRGRQKERAPGGVRDVGDRVVITLDVLERELRRDRDRHDTAHHGAQERQHEPSGSGTAMQTRSPFWGPRVELGGPLLGEGVDLRTLQAALRAVGTDARP